MRNIILVITLAISTLTSCKEKNIETYKNNKQVELASNDQVVKIDFLESLEDICVQDDGVFKNCDELFSKEGASLFFIIIPKMGAKNWFWICKQKLQFKLSDIFV